MNADRSAGTKLLHRIFVCVMLVTWLTVTASHGRAQAPGRWAPQAVIVEASLRGVSVVDAKTIWVSGAKGTVLRSVDSGKSFQKLPSPAGSEVDYRDIHGFDSKRACLLTAGQPAKLFYTENAGQNWSVAFESKNPKAFFNAMDFWDGTRGIAFSDAIDGRLLIVHTTDGGRSWQAAKAARRPAIADSEHGFAASGTCLATGPKGLVWIGLGGKAKDGTPARVLHSSDFGRTWSSTKSGLQGSASAGVFSLAVGANGVLVGVGGDYKEESRADSVLARSEDAGKTWSAPSRHGMSGYRSCVAFSQGRTAKELVAVGPNGADFSLDVGKTWHRLSGPGYHACSFAPAGGFGWAVGADGRMARWMSIVK